MASYFELLSITQIETVCTWSAHVESGGKKDNVGERKRKWVTDVSPEYS
jgi:hypothetical protein